MSHPIVLNPEIVERLQAAYTESRKAARPETVDFMTGKVFNLDATNYLSKFPDESIDVIMTDEPFGIAGSSIITFTDRKPYQFNFDWDGDIPAHLSTPWVFEAARVLKTGGVLFNMGMVSWATSFANICSLAGLQVRTNDVWIRPNPPVRVRHGGWRSGHILLWVASKGSLSKRMNSLVRQQELLNWTVSTSCPACEVDFPVVVSKNYRTRDLEWVRKVKDWAPVAHLAPGARPKDKLGHETSQPEWLAYKYLWLLASIGDIVVDPFCGTNVFCRIAKKMGLRVSANDLNEHWARVAKNQFDHGQLPMFPPEESNRKG